MSAKKIVDPSYTNYQDVFYRNFEWGVLENALKWRQTEWNQVEHKYTHFRREFSLKVYTYVHIYVTIDQVVNF